MALIAAIYAPLDGMNEKGLVVFDSKALTATYYQYSDFDKPYTTRVLK